MNYLLLILFIAIIVLIALLRKPLATQLGGGQGSKCYSCEMQDYNNGVQREYGSKCFDCELQLNA